MPAVVEVENLRKLYPVRAGFMSTLRREPRKQVHAVDGVSFEVGEGEILGLVGESGCGKTTTGRLITRLETPSEGVIRFKGDDLATLPAGVLRPIREHLQIIFQDPYDSLDPRFTVEMVVQEPLKALGLGDLSDRKQRVEEILRLVELVPPKLFMPRYPHELSGGQRQRVAIARAMVVNPSFVVADEPVSMLDVSIRAGVLGLMQKLNRETGVSFLLITHDLSVARYMSDRIAVMYLGKVVEIGPKEDVIQRPRHPYTRLLISAVPEPVPGARRPLEQGQGEVPSAIDPPSGCRFHPRCPFAKEICSQEEPLLRELDTGHRVACHFAEELPEMDSPVSVAVSPKPTDTTNGAQSVQP